MPYLGIYAWAQYTVPAGIPAADLLTDSHANDPASPIYDGSNPISWIGETFSFNGGPPTQIQITDDDEYFEDGYVETGAPQTLTTGVTIDGTFYAAGSVVQNEFMMLDGSGNEVWIVAINGQNVGFAYANGNAPTIGETFSGATGLDGDPADNADGASSSTSPYTNIICYGEGTQIATSRGPRQVEDLRCGDLVTTLDQGDQPLQWIGRTEVSMSGGCKNIVPVLLPAGSLGCGLPERDLVVSQQHRMLIQAGGQDVFAPAKGLLPLMRVRLMKGVASVTYFHLLLPRHAVIFAEGAQSESFYPGATALDMMTTQQRQGVLAVYPSLGEDPEGGYGPLARHSLSVREARAWARHARGKLGALQAAPMEAPLALASV